jgi:hypothetical protein
MTIERSGVSELQLLSIPAEPSEVLELDTPKLMALAASG